MPYFRSSALTVGDEEPFFSKVEELTVGQVERSVAEFHYGFGTLTESMQEFLGIIGKRQTLQIVERLLDNFNRISTLAKVA